MHEPLSQDRPAADRPRRPHPRRVRVAESGLPTHRPTRPANPSPARYEFTYRDATGRQIWQTAKGDTNADAKAERAELLARMHKGERVERTTLTVAEVAELWLERGVAASKASGQPLDARTLRARSSAATSTPPPTPPGTPIGAVKLRDLTVDRVAAWSAANERVLAPTTARDRADRAQPGLPLRRPPRLARRQPRRQARTRRETPLDTQAGRHASNATSSASFLDHAGKHRGRCSSSSPTPASASAKRSASPGPTSTTQAASIRVHRQLARDREHAPLKTPAANREVVLAPASRKALRERWLASPYKRPTTSSSPTRIGSGLDYRNVGERLPRQPSEPPSCTRPASSRSTPSATATPRS